MGPGSSTEETGRLLRCSKMAVCVSVVLQAGMQERHSGDRRLCLVGWVTVERARSRVTRKARRHWRCVGRVYQYGRRSPC